MCNPRTVVAVDIGSVSNTADNRTKRHRVTLIKMCNAVGVFELPIRITATVSGQRDHLELGALSLLSVHYQMIRSTYI